jgi:DNA ligase 4
MPLITGSIRGFRDTADLAIVGGRREPKMKQGLGLGKLSWTPFYLTCLNNKGPPSRPKSQLS